MNNYKRLKVWQEAHKLALAAYSRSEEFPKREMFGITDQLRRAATSIPANIAEGCGSISKREFVRYLHISLASTNETEYLLLLCKDLGYLKQPCHHELSDQVGNIKRMLIGLIRHQKS